MNEHREFHRKAASSARTMARELFAQSGYDRQTLNYRKGLTFDRLADQHDLTASGKMTFIDCPNCHVVTK